MSGTDTPAKSLELDEAFPEPRGAQRDGNRDAAIVMRALGVAASGIWPLLDEDVYRDLTQAVMDVNVQAADPGQRKRILETLVRFSEDMSFAKAAGAADPRKLLQDAAQSERERERARELAELNGAQNAWEQMAAAPPQQLRDYLMKEQPATAAYILFKLPKDRAAKVLAGMDEAKSLELIKAGISMDPVQRDAAQGMEMAIQQDFSAGLNSVANNDPYQQMADIFNAFSRNDEARIMKVVEEDNQENAERIRGLMFTFEDLNKLSDVAFSTMVRKIAKARLGVALKGATPQLRDRFLRAMTARAAQSLREELEVMGPKKQREVQTAQSEIVQEVKRLEREGDITIDEDRDEYVD